MSNPYRYDCGTCINKCDGKSKGKYIFSNDVEFSEFFENHLISKINKVSDVIKIIEEIEENDTGKMLDKNFVPKIINIFKKYCQ
mgnify:CR=1 FL=1